MVVSGAMVSPCHMVPRSVIVYMWRLLLSDEESNELLDSEELLVNSNDNSDEWHQEHLLSEDHVEVGHT